jgi:hypothetical protein
MSEVEAETAADRTGAARDAQWPRPTVAGPPTNPEAVRTDSINIGKENRLGLWSPFRQRDIDIREFLIGYNSSSTATYHSVCSPLLVEPDVQIPISLFF